MGWEIGCALNKQQTIIWTSYEQVAEAYVKLYFLKEKPITHQAWVMQIHICTLGYHWFR